MVFQSAPATAEALEVCVHDARTLPERLPRLESYVMQGGQVPLSRHPAWLLVLQHGLQQIPYCLEVLSGEETRGFLALVYLRSFLFGRFLVGLPYLNYGGVVARDDAAARMLIDQAVALA